MTQLKSTTAPLQDTNIAKESKRLLDIISEVKNVKTALEHFKDKHAHCLHKDAVEDLGILILSLQCIHNGGKEQTAKVSRVSYLLRAYNQCQKEERKRKREASTRTIVQGKAAIRNLREFVKRCKVKVGSVNVTPEK